MAVERLPAVRVSEGVLPPGKHLFVPLEWVDRPDKEGWWWVAWPLKAIGPVHVSHGYHKDDEMVVEVMGNRVRIRVGDLQHARWLWLGDLVAAAEREAKG